ncbi:hypothetical protein AMTRI_Chr03g47250 [Amborella trichopoda]
MKEVFLNFCHRDTGKGFTAHLDNALRDSGISTFFLYTQQHHQQDGDTNGQRGEAVLPDDIKRAIEESQVFISIFSCNYASSVSCLEELSCMVRVLQVKKKTIFPVFYDVDPADVRRQMGSFRVPFWRHRIWYDGEKVERWRNALRVVGEVSGWDLKNFGDGRDAYRNEANFISKVVESVLAELNYTPLNITDHIIGLDSRVDDVMRLLDINADDVRLIGIYGMGGIGKTTLAKAVYNKLYSSFKGSCFLPDIREASQPYTREGSQSLHGLLSLQKLLLHDMFNEENPNINDVDRGINVIRNRIGSKRVLMILDDVDHEKQLEKLVGKREWYCPGSRIVVTTRNEHVLNVYKIDKHHIYELKVLDHTQSRKLFSRYAFGMDEPVRDYMELSEDVVSIAGGLPLALEVMGSYLSDKTTIEEWEDAVSKLRKIPEDDVLQKLKISYDGLIEEERHMFLDIACFLIGKDKDYAIHFWKGCGFPNLIKNLLQKSLIKVDEKNKLRMHDQLRDMGRRIVEIEKLEEPGRRSRLWFRDDVFDVLKNHKGTKKVRGLILNLQENDETSWETEAFQPMTNLKLLSINGTFLDGLFKVFPKELIWLQWEGCPLRSLPNYLCYKNLAVLDLSYSSIRHLWRKESQDQLIQKLKVLDLAYCDLLRTPNFSTCPNLEKLNLKTCMELVEVHDSISLLGKLVYLNLKNCKNLKKLPDSVSGLHSLQKLNLSCCIQLGELPEQLGSLESLTELLLDRTAIKQLPESIGRLKKLRRLCLIACRDLDELPISIGALQSLQELLVDWSSVRELPNSIGSLKRLQILSAKSCRSLTALPKTIGDLASLGDLFLDYTPISELPSSFWKLSNLKRLWVRGCKSLSGIPDSVDMPKMLVRRCLDRTEMMGLKILVEHHFNSTEMVEVPVSVTALSQLEELNLKGSILFGKLPDSVKNLGNLRTLILDRTIIKELPESIGSLVNLEKLSLSNCKVLSRLPASMGKMKSLHHLNIEETAVAELPDDFGLLSNLVVLKMAHCPHFKELPEGFGSLAMLKFLDIQYNGELKRFPSTFPGLCSLRVLNADHCNLQGTIQDEFEKLSSLTTLNLSYNKIHKLPSSMSGFSRLTTLCVSHCVELLSIPKLPTSLAYLDASNCTKMRTISDLSNLSKLKELGLTNCERLTEIQGLDKLKSLTYLYLNGCTHPSRSIAKETFEHLRCFGVSGSNVPDWFMCQSLSYMISGMSDHGVEIRGVILCLVISLDNEIPTEIDDWGIPDVELTITRDGIERFSSTLRLEMLPKARQDQVYLFHFQEGDDVLLMLGDGDQIEVLNRSPPEFPCVQMKKGGIHLVYKPEDTHESIQEKLADFFNSLNCHDSS